MAALGELAGVLQLFVAHERDGKAIAQRLGAPFLSLPDQVPDAPFSVLRLDSVKVWKERALWWPEPKGLVVAESIGTATHYAVGEGPAGVHMIRRPLPPNTLKSFKPEHLLVGHGRPLHGERGRRGPARRAATAHDVTFRPSSDACRASSGACVAEAR